MKTSGRFSGQLPFQHLQQSNLPHHAPSHQPSNSAGLPPPSFNHAFGQGNPNANINPFAPTGNLSGLAGGFGPGGGLGAGGTGLASREAQMGFAHGAALQQQQQAREQMRRSSGGVSKAQLKSRIRDVWRGNLAQEMQVLRELVEKYPYISMVGPYSNFAYPIDVLFISYVVGRPLLNISGHRIPRHCSSTYGCFHNEARLSLSSTSLQRRPPEGYSAWYHSF